MCVQSGSSNLLKIKMKIAGTCGKAEERNSEEKGGETTCKAKKQAQTAKAFILFPRILRFSNVISNVSTVKTCASVFFDTISKPSNRRGGIKKGGGIESETK